jgi:hypothetical protein
MARVQAGDRDNTYRIGHHRSSIIVLDFAWYLFGMV